MDKENDKIGLVTPLRNEYDNIPKLIASIERQSIEIACWVILENDSTDGSKEFLEKNQNEIQNVRTIHVLNLDMNNKGYELGSKYASIINTGFIFLRDKGIDEQLDYIGILDADCFPEKDYYKGLIDTFRKDPMLGISSGVIYDFEGNADIASKEWVRGGCRLWSYSCFSKVGYILGPSADTLSAIKAIIMGWSVYTNTNLKVYSRMLGSRVNFSYYGYSAYFRGNTLIYAILKSIKFIFKQEFKKGYEYLRGYLQSFFQKKERVEDEDIRNYFRNYLSNTVLKRIKPLSQID